MKRTYIQPAIDTMILPKDALMDEITLSSSGSMGTVGKTPAPRAATPTKPVMPLDSVAVF